MIQLTKTQAKAFILYKHGLLGDYQYQGETGIEAFIQSVGCVQFDPIDICGRNIDIILFSRVQDYTKDKLDSLLYEKRRLVDQWDKNMAVYSLQDWPHYIRMREHGAKQYHPHMKGYEKEIEQVIAILRQYPFVTNKDIPLEEPVNFYTWRHKKLAQAILDYLFFKGDAIIHHRQGVKRYFALASKYLDSSIISQKDPFANAHEFKQYQIKRRIGAVGLLSSGRSDAYLGIYDLTSKQRQVYCEKLVQQGELIPCQIEGSKEVYYLRKEDELFLYNIPSSQSRLEFIAPLDNVIWDRKLIQRLFDFDYKWEIYTVESKRKYGAYVLPILYNQDFVGRIEMSVERKKKQLLIQHIWLEKSNLGDEFDQLLQQRLHDFARFNNCFEIVDETTKKTKKVKG